MVFVRLSLCSSVHPYVNTKSYHELSHLAVHCLQRYQYLYAVMKGLKYFDSLNGHFISWAQLFKTNNAINIPLTYH